MVCKKYYLQVVLKEIDTTSTYERVMVESQSIVDKHIKTSITTIFMYHHNANAYLSLIGFQNFISSHMVRGLLQHHISALLNLCLNYLLVA